MCHCVSLFLNILTFTAVAKSSIRWNSISPNNTPMNTTQLFIKWQRRRGNDMNSDYTFCKSISSNTILPQNYFANSFNEYLNISRSACHTMFSILRESVISLLRENTDLDLHKSHHSQRTTNCNPRVTGILKR